MNRVIQGVNDLATVRPDLAKQWDAEANAPLTPHDVAVFSNKKVWWRCNKKNHHRWEATVNSRSYHERGCPYCSHQKPFVGETDLGSVNPTLASQWDDEANAPFTPQDVTASSRKHVWWVCDKGHKWIASVNSRASGTGCPYCSNKRALAGETDLGTCKPQLALQWDYKTNYPLTPQEVTIGSGKIVGWICSRNSKHTWKASVYDRAKGSGCPYCSGRKPFAGETDLGTLNPFLASQWDYEANSPLTPQDVTPSSNKKVHWRCSRNPNHMWEATVSSRTGGSGCPCCGHRAVFEGETDLMTVYPILAAEWDYEANGLLRPQDITASSNKMAYWRCNRNSLHTWSATVNSRAGGKGCPYCARTKPWIGETDLATTNPTLAAEWDFEANAPLTPQDVLEGSSKNVWWKCSVDSDHKWRAAISDRAGGNGCPFCAQQRPVPGKTDLETVNPKLAAQWDREKNAPLTARDVAAKSHKTVWWVCTRKAYHRWQAPISNRANGSDCPYCDGKLPWVGETDLGTVDPDLSKQWDYEVNAPLTPQDVTAHSGKKVGWVCPENPAHKWRATVNDRVSGSGCPYCYNRKPVKRSLS